MRSYRDIVAAGAEENVRWTVEGFMREGTLAMLAGDSKIGKTALITNLAFCVASGRPFLGMATPQAPVLWVTYEESDAERAYLFKGYDESAIHTASNPGPIDTEEGMRNIRQLMDMVEELEGKPVGLVVVDPLAAAVRTDSLAEMVKARKAIQPLNDLRRELGVSVLLIHHARKAGGAKGDQNKIADSHQIQAAVSQWWVFEVRKGSPRMITLYGKGRGREANRDWSIRSADEWSFERMADVPARAERSPHDRFLDILGTSDGPVTSAKVASDAGLNRRYAQKIAKELLDAGKIEKQGKTGKSDLWALVS